jgi:hypothetical protein
VDYDEGEEVTTMGRGGGTKDKARRAKEREFKIASVGFADTLGIGTLLFHTFLLFFHQRFDSWV